MRCFVRRYSLPENEEPSAKKSSEKIGGKDGSVSTIHPVERSTVDSAALDHITKMSDKIEHRCSKPDEFSRRTKV